MLYFILGILGLVIGLPIASFFVFKGKKPPRNAWLILIILIASVVLLIIGYAEGTKRTKQLRAIEIDKLENEPLEFEEDGVTVKYLKSEVSDGFLYVYFEMLNESGEDVRFDCTYSIFAYQDGTGLEEDIYFNCEEERNGSKETRDGEKTVVADVFKLRNLDSDVRVMVTYWINLFDEKLLEFEIELK